MNDESLMLSVQKDNQKAFKKLFDKYKKPILSYIKQFVRNHEKAEELTHEAFLRVYRNRHSYNSDYRFTTWLWTIAKNLTFDYLKKKKEILSDDYNNGESSIIDQIESPEMGIEQSLIEQANLEVLDQCFNKLKLDQKEALGLRVYSDLSYDEIAKSMNISLGAVKSLINRGKKALTICVKQCSEKEVI